MRMLCWSRPSKVRLSSEPTDNVTIYASSSDTTEGVIVSIGGDTNNTSNLTFTSSSGILLNQ